MKVAVWAIEGLRLISRSERCRSSVALLLRNILRLVRPRGERILSNLALVYPESTESWRRDLRRRLYDHLGWLVTEVLTLQRDPTQALSWVEEVRNVHHIERPLAEGRGVLFLSGHYGNWELLAAWYAQFLKARGFENFHVVSQSTRDKDIARLIEQYRENAGIRLLSKGTSTLEIVRVLKAGGHIAALADISWLGGIRLPFLGHECTHTTGPAVLGTLAFVPIIPVAIYRKGPFRHAVEFFPPIPVPAENNRMLRIERMTQSVIGALETMINRQPELWFWLHNRWKQ